jgi:ryanodine receptor 2
MVYIPRPIPTDTVKLPGKLLSLVEQLAENNHDVWALGRLEQGWQYGDERNDVLKTHPGLVPYDALPEDEKVFDRNTVLESLKVIVALGYRIVPPSL